MLYQVLFYFLRPHKLLYGGILAVTVGASVLESFGLVAFFPIFSALLGESTGDAGGILGLVTGAVGLLPFSDPIVAGGALLISIFLLKTLLILSREGATAYASGQVLYETKNQVMGRYAQADYQFFLDNKQGALIYNSLVAPHRVAAMLLRTPQMAAEILRIIAIFVVLLLVSPLATLAITVLGLGYFGAIHYLSKAVSYKIGQGEAAADSAQNVIVNEFLFGIRHILSFRIGKTWLERFEDENRTYSKLFAKHQIWLAVPKSLIEVTAVVMMLGLLLILRAVSPSTFVDSLPKLGIFAVALVQLLPSVTSFGRMRMQMLESLPDTELVYHTLTGQVSPRRDGAKSLGSFKESIKFNNVSFAHKDRDTLLKDVNLTFEKGKVTAIVGPSGAGKTTIINLILGLFEPTKGTVTVDGEPLREYKLDTWLSRVGFVGQEPFIYHATVAENISFGRNRHSLESIISAARIANAHGFISELPQGYDTIVGDRGMKLSGGQQQRISIARAVLDQPEILIFDEATSSLDSISEKLVQQAIDNLSQDRTVIIIAHRLSTIRYADRITVLEQGQVVEEGTHQELLEKQGSYSQLVASSR